jgi:hypothetical protein
MIFFVAILEILRSQTTRASSDAVAANLEAAAETKPTILKEIPTK